LVVALHSTNQDSKALEVCRHAVRLPYEQGIQESFRIWLAMEEALAGNTAAATQLCDGLKAETLQGPNKYFHGLTQAILKVQTSPRDQRSVAFKEARRVLQKTFSGINVFDAGKSIRRFYRRSVRRIALDCGSFSAKIWSWSHQINRANVMIFFLLLGIAGAVYNPEFAPLLFIYSMGMFFYLRWKR
jgi:hypothetical protein